MGRAYIFITTLHGSYGNVEKHQVQHLQNSSMGEFATWRIQNIHPLGEAILALCCFSSKQTSYFFPSKEGGGLDKLKHCYLDKLKFLLGKNIDDQWKYLGVLGATHTPGGCNQSIDGRGMDPKWTFEFAVPWRCANSLRHGDSCVVPHLNGGESGRKGHPAQYDVMVQILISLRIDSNCSGISICFY